MENNVVVKEKLNGIVFARALCALGIIVFHWNCHTNATFKFLLDTANCCWGSLFVTVFFAISGCVLSYNYSQGYSLKKYYYKRWKGIYPIYYITWFLIYMEISIVKHNFIWEKPIYLYKTLIGFDGFSLPSYGCVGEWFLAVIITMYVFFPLMNYLMNKKYCKWIVPFIIILLNVIRVTSNHRNGFNSISVSAISFYFGMIVARHREFFFKNWILGIVSLILFVLLCCIKVEFVYHYNFEFILWSLQGLLFFIVLVQIGEYVMKLKINTCISKLSNLCYLIFLIQHQVIFQIFHFYNPEKMYIVIPLMFADILITILGAKVLDLIQKGLFKTKLFKLLDGKFLS